MLVQCAECENAISDAAAACPQCGHPQSKPEIIPTPRKPRSKWMPFVYVAGVILFINVIKRIDPSASAPVQTRSARPSPSASTSEATERATLSALYVASLRRSLRDPESLDVESVLADDDAKHVCITYRAKNGFGGTNFSSVVFTSAGGDQSSGAWNRHCAHKELNDEKYMALALSRTIRRE